MSRQIGNRGAVLIILGILWLLTAYRVGTTPVSRPGGQLLPYEHFPIWFRVSLWGLPALAAFAGAVWKQWDPVAWALLIAPVVERALSFLYVWVIDIFIGGYPTAWGGVLLYVELVLLIFFCARGLDRPPPEIGLRETDNA